MADYIPARPTVYKGIKMRSRLEAGFAAWLDKVHLSWEYEPEAFASEEGQYLPDFRLRDIECIGIAARRDVYIEVKPRFWPRCREDLDRLLRSMVVIRRSDPNAVLLIVRDEDIAENEVLWMSAVIGGIDSPIDQTRVAWIRLGDEGPLALGFPLRAGGGPWRGDYWRVD